MGLVVQFETPLDKEIFLNITHPIVGNIYDSANKIFNTYYTSKSAIKGQMKVIMMQLGGDEAALK